MIISKKEIIIKKINTFTKRIILFFFFSLVVFGQNQSIDYNHYITVNPDSLIEFIKSIRNTDPVKGLSVSKFVIENNQSFKNEILKGKLIDEIGVLYKKTGNLDSSLFYHQKALKLFRLKNYKIGIAYALSNLGNILRIMKNYEMALTYYNESLSIKKELKDDNQIAYTLLNIGLLYEKMDSNKLALEYLNLALEIKNKFNDKIGMANIYNSIATIEKKLKKYNDARIHLNKALEIYEKSSSFYGASEVLFFLSNIEKQQENLEQSLIYLNRAEYYAKKISSDILLFDIYKLYSLIEYSRGNYKKAYDYEKQSDILKNRVESREFERKISEFRLNLQIEKEQKKNELLQHINLVKDTKIENDRIFRNFLIIIALMMAIFGIVYVYRYKQRVKLYREISQQKSELEKLNVELQEANATKDKFFSIIAHDLRNPFGTIMNYSEMMYKDFDELLEIEKKDFARRIMTGSAKVYELFENLLNWALSQKNRLTKNMLSFSLNNIVKDVIDKLSELAEGKSLKIELYSDEEIKIETDEFMLKTILRNIINNSIKYSHRGNSIEVYLSKSEKFCEIRIKDFGIGMDSETVDKIFSFGKIKSKRGTEDETGTGLGMILVREFIHQLNGTIDVFSEPMIGSEFIIKLYNK